MKPEYVQTETELETLCRRLNDRELIAFDTEFVAEDSYRPQLCLVQVAVHDHIAIIDPLACPNLEPFWNLLLDAGRKVVVHAGREEILFCFRATGKTIPNLFDVQIAAGFLGSEYPASYGNLVQRYVGKQLGKEETRSDWRHRPLTPRQLDYAAQDVRDLPLIFDKLSKDLLAKGRLEWLKEEILAKQSDLAAFERQENWFRMAGMQSLTGQSLAIARRIWLWREEIAIDKDIPARRVLRDDLVVELAKRGTGDIKRIANLRGMNHRHSRFQLEDLAKCIDQGQADPIPTWPKRTRYGFRQPSGMLTQFLGAALAFICRSKQIAPAIVGTSDDLRDFALYRLENQPKDQQPPSLLTGWRKSVIGERLDDLLQGKLGLALDNPLDEMPLRFCHNEPLKDG